MHRNNNNRYLIFGMKKMGDQTPSDSTTRTLNSDNPNISTHTLSLYLYLTTSMLTHGPHVIMTTLPLFKQKPTESDPNLFMPCPTHKNPHCHFALYLVRSKRTFLTNMYGSLSTDTLRARLVISFRNLRNASNLGVHCNEWVARPWIITPRRIESENINLVS